MTIGPDSYGQDRRSLGFSIFQIPVRRLYIREGIRLVDMNLHGTAADHFEQILGMSQKIIPFFRIGHQAGAR